MKRRVFLGSAAAAMACGVRTSSAQSPANGPAAKGLGAFDELMHGIIHRQNLPGGSLALAKDGKLVYARAFGWASVEARVPARPDTLFGQASVSKAVTAAAIMRLVDQGRLRLEDRAFDVLKDLVRAHHIDPRAHATTIRQLLLHAGGYKEQPDEAQVAHQLKMPLGRLREEHLVASFMGRRLDYDPGTHQEYSNFGFVVLGAVVARVAGEETGPAIHKLVFNPMGIRHAYYGHGGPHRPDTAIPYDDHNKPMPSIDIAGGSAGGLVISTVELAKFLAALRGVHGRPFLSQEAYAEMLAPSHPPLQGRGKGTWYGLGWDGVTPSPRGPSYTKNGGMGGVRAVIGHHAAGVDYAAAFNGGRDVKGHIDVDAEAIQLVNREIDRVREWPDGVDHFPEFAARHRKRQSVAAIFMP